MPATLTQKQMDNSLFSLPPTVQKWRPAASLCSSKWVVKPYGSTFLPIHLPSSIASKAQGLIMAFPLFYTCIKLLIKTSLIRKNEDLKIHQCVSHKGNMVYGQYCSQQMLMALNNFYWMYKWLTSTHFCRESVLSGRKEVLCMTGMPFLGNRFAHRWV